MDYTLYGPRDIASMAPPEKSETKLLQILTEWGQHPDASDPDLHGSTLYVNTADLNQLAKLILEAGFQLGQEA